MKKTTKIRKPKCLKLLKFLIPAILQMEVWTKEIVTLDVHKKGKVIPDLLWVRCPAFNPDRYTLQSHETFIPRAPPSTVLCTNCQEGLFDYLQLRLHLPLITFCTALIYKGCFSSPPSWGGGAKLTFNKNKK